MKSHGRHTSHNGRMPDETIKRSNKNAERTTRGSSRSGTGRSGGATSPTVAPKQKPTLVYFLTTAVLTGRSNSLELAQPFGKLQSWRCRTTFTHLRRAAHEHEHAHARGRGRFTGELDRVVDPSVRSEPHPRVMVSGSEQPTPADAYE